MPRGGILCLTPVAPHSLNLRPIVFSDDVVIHLEVESRSHNYLVAIDGRSVKLKRRYNTDYSESTFRNSNS